MSFDRCSIRLARLLHCKTLPHFLIWPKLQHKAADHGMDNTAASKQQDDKLGVSTDRHSRFTSVALTTDL